MCVKCAWYNNANTHSPTRLADLVQEQAFNYRYAVADAWIYVLAYVWCRVNCVLLICNRFLELWFAVL